MKEFRGVCSEHFVADEDLSFHGIAETGLTVRAGITVNLHGLLQGRVIVEKDASLNIYGRVEGEIDDQGGKIVVRGASNGNAGKSVLQ